MFDKIPSTQNCALDLVATGRATDHTAIVAAAQSDGRGRYRRTWVSHHGNLYVSFIFDAPTRDPKLSYVIAVAVAETVLSFGVNAQIKWPNDILVDGGKISGSLLEYAGDFVVVGIGINITTCPELDEYKTTKLANYADCNRMDVLRRLMRNIDKWLCADFSDVRLRWMELALAVNGTVFYRGTPVQMIEISENGALVLRRGAEYLLVYGDEIQI